MRNKFVHQPPHFAECPRSSWSVEFVVHWVKLWQCEEGIAELPNTVVSSLLFCLDEFSHPCTEFQGDLIAGLMPPCALAGIPARLGQHKVQDDSGLCRLQLQGSYRCWGCHVAAGMEEAIFPQILIICPQNLLPEISFGCNYSNSSHCSVGAVFDNLQLGENLWIKEEVGHILACKTQNHHLKLGEVCGEAISWTGTAAVEKPEACMKCSGCLQVPILTFILIFTVQQCWVERAHGCILPPFLSFQIPVWIQFWNNFLQVMRYLVTLLFLWDLALGTVH